MDEQVVDYFQQMQRMIRALPTADIATCVRVLKKVHAEDGTVFLVGNGGSAATASHFANDLSKLTRHPGVRPMRVLALTDNVPSLTAWANDESYEDIFARQLDAFISPGDVLVAISGSGNSPNVLSAARIARERKAQTIGLTGFGGGQLKALVDYCVVVPAHNTQLVEDAHMMIAHVTSVCLRDALKPEMDQLRLRIAAATA